MHAYSFSCRLTRDGSCRLVIAPNTVVNSSMVAYLPFPTLPRVARMNYLSRRALIPNTEWKSAPLLAIRFSWVLLSGLRKAFTGHLCQALSVIELLVGWRCYGSSENKEIGEFPDMSWSSPIWHDADFTTVWSGDYAMNETIWKGLKYQYEETSEWDDGSCIFRKSEPTIWEGIEQPNTNLENSTYELHSKMIVW